MSRPLLVIPLGDPYSINIEALFHLADTKIMKAIAAHSRVMIIGSHFQLIDQARRLRQTCSTFIENNFYDISGPKISAEFLTDQQRGALAIASLEAVPSTFAGTLAVVTCPIDKNACSVAGWEFPGQTEFFSAHWGGMSIMTMEGPQLVVGLVTNHLALDQVTSKITQSLIVKKARILSHFISTVREDTRPLAICGLNPHCGDGGLFGHEDELVVVPAVQQLMAEGLAVVGPVPADSAFHLAASGQFSGVLAMYHDQGLAPFKTLHFHGGVNMTLGLKHFRVSPDHGPASDHFLRHSASFASFERSLARAYQYISHNQHIDRDRSCSRLMDIRQDSHH